MAGSVASAETFAFDDCNIRWHKFGDFKHGEDEVLEIAEAHS